MATAAKALFASQIDDFMGEMTPSEAKFLVQIPKIFSVHVAEDVLKKRR